MIISAALRINKPEFGEGGLIIPCLRHHYGYAILHALCPDEKLWIGAEDGFMDHLGCFHDRTEAYEIAKECGQIPAQLRHDKSEEGCTMLYSEDLY